jgi:hypothetical protein
MPRPRKKFPTRCESSRGYLFAKDHTGKQHGFAPASDPASHLGQDGASLASRPAGRLPVSARQTRDAGADDGNFHGKLPPLLDVAVQR